MYQGPHRQTGMGFRQWMEHSTLVSIKFQMTKNTGICAMMVALNKMLQNSVQNFKLWCVIDQNNLEFALYHCV